MLQSINAVFVNGVFLPESPVSLDEGAHVTLRVEHRMNPESDLDDVRDLLDSESRDSSEATERAPPLADIQAKLAGIGRSLSQMICAERDER